MFKGDRKGFVLVLAVLTTTVLMALVIPYVSRVATDYSLTYRVYNSTEALNLAESGADEAIWDVKYNNKIANFNIPVTVLQSSAGENMGEYEAAVNFPDSNSIIVTSHGYVPSKAACKAEKTVVVKYSLHRPFANGVTAASGITMSGQADIDSFDSSLGAYNALLANGTTNRGQEGNIATNGPINLTGQSKVYGNANPGPDYPFTGTPNVTGTYGTLQAPIVVDEIPDNIITSAAGTNNNSNITKNVLVNGVMTKVPYTMTNNVLSDSTYTLNLSGGTYYFKSVTITGTSQINIEGPSIVYVVGDIDIEGQGVVNEAGMPRNFQLYSTGTSIKIAGQGAFYGAVYAPQATVTYTGQADFYGSIICGLNADKGQAALHYDKDLASVMPSFVAGKVSSWQEMLQ